jgi:hypothetical protein
LIEAEEDGIGLVALPVEDEELGGLLLLGIRGGRIERKVEVLHETRARLRASGRREKESESRECD